MNICNFATSIFYQKIARKKVARVNAAPFQSSFFIVDQKVGKSVKFILSKVNNFSILYCHFVSIVTEN